MGLVVEGHMFIPGCIIAIALFIFTGDPHDPQTERERQQDAARQHNQR